MAPEKLTLLLVEDDYFSPQVYTTSFDGELFDVSNQPPSHPEVAVAAERAREAEAKRLAPRRGWDGFHGRGRGLW